MPKYLVTYRRWSDFQTVVEANSPEEAEDTLINQGIEVEDHDFIMSDLDYDSIDVMETE